MSASRVTRIVAVLTASLALAGCSFLPIEAPRSQRIEIQPLFTTGNGTGGVGSEVITHAGTDDGSFRLDFSEDEVSGLGESSRAASWDAAIVSTLLGGQPLSGRFGFEIEGRIDGPSAGALKTVALLALQNGDTLREDTTMTGTINATGTIGPVGGIPEKIRGAADAGIQTVLIPLGQRNSVDEAGESVDVIREGDRLGVEVVEVGDVYEAYPLLTDGDLPRPAPANDPRLDNRSYDKVDAQVTAALGRYQAALQSYQGLGPGITAALDATALPATATASADTAADLEREGAIAGAFDQAQQAAALMETLAATANLLTPLQTQGIAGLGSVLDQATNTGPTEAKFFSFMDSLGTFAPETIPDVEAIVNAYAGAFDAFTLLDFASQQISSLQSDYEAGAVADLEEFFGRLSIALVYLRLSESQVENAQAVFEVGRDNPGVAPGTDIDLFQVGDFFRRGADANYAAFSTSGTVKELADSNGLSTEIVISYLSDYDLNVALAAHQQAVLPALQAYIGEDEPNAAYAAMGYGLSNYVRNQVLVEKYYNNAVLDDQFQTTGLLFEGSLDNAIELSRSQLGAEISVLRDRGAAPVIIVGSYESAARTGTGTPDEKFQTLGAYSGGFVTARLLSYLGGWERDGL